MNATQVNGITFYRTTSDIYGNPRYIVHFLAFLGENEHEDKTIMEQYAIAHKRAKKAGFSKYRGKSFGGGFVCQSYNLEDTAKWILDQINNH